MSAFYHHLSAAYCCLVSLSSPKRLSCHTQMYLQFQKYPSSASTSGFYLWCFFYFKHSFFSLLDYTSFKTQPNMIFLRWQRSCVICFHSIMYIAYQCADYTDFNSIFVGSPTWPQMPSGEHLCLFFMPEPSICLTPSGYSTNISWIIA